MELGKRGKVVCSNSWRQKSSRVQHSQPEDREFLPWEPGVPSCWVVSSQENARDHCPIGHRFLVFILSSLFFQSVFVVHSLNILVLLIVVCCVQLCPTVLPPYGLQLARLCPWDLPSKNTGVACRFVLQGIFLTRGLNLPLSHILLCRWTLSLWASGEAFRSFSLAVELTSLSVVCFSWFLRRLTLVSGHCFSGRDHLRPLERLYRILFPATGPEHALVFTSVLRSFSLALSNQHPIVYHFLRDLLPKTPPSLSRIPFVLGLSSSSAFQAGKKFHRILSHFLNSFPLISISWKLSVSITFQDIILFSHPHLCTLTSRCRLEARFI